jgi:hypothetical protein
VLNVHGVHNIRQKDIHTAEPLVSEPSLVKVEIAIGKLKKYNPAELIKAGGETLCSEMCKLVLYGIRRNCHSNGRNLLYKFIKRVMRVTVIIIKESPSYQLPT